MTTAALFSFDALDALGALLLAPPATKGVVTLAFDAVVGRCKSCNPAVALALIRGGDLMCNDAEFAVDFAPESE